MAALCWQQKCFKWAIFNKEFNRKKIFHHLQIQDWAVGPQDPHRWLTWNMRTRCWVQVLEPRLCSPPSPIPSRRPQLCVSLFFIILNCFFRVFLYFLLSWIVFSLFFSIFHFFHCPNNGFACSMLTTVGGVVLSRFWHSLTWNRSTIWAPKQLPLCPDLDLLHSFGHVLKPVILGVALCWHQNASNEQF